MSCKGDVFVAGINHRLNIFGFLDLSAYGEEYKYSGNLGMMDIIATPTWSPVNDRNYIPEDVAESVFPEQAKDIPMIIGSTLNELIPSPLLAVRFSDLILQQNSVILCCSFCAALHAILYKIHNNNILNICLVEVQHMKLAQKQRR